MLTFVSYSFVVINLSVKNMTYFANLTLLISISILSGCATIKEPLPTGGSRSDGVIELSNEYGMFESPKIDWNKANISARQRCVAWGYADAEPFGVSKSQCQAYDGYGSCVRMYVTTSYQCTGGSVK